MNYAALMGSDYGFDDETPIGEETKGNAPDTSITRSQYDPTHDPLTYPMIRIREYREEKKGDTSGTSSIPVYISNS